MSCGRHGCNVQMLVMNYQPWNRSSHSSMPVENRTKVLHACVCCVFFRVIVSFELFGIYIIDHFIVTTGRSSSICHWGMVSSWCIPWDTSCHGPWSLPLDPRCDENLRFWHWDARVFVSKALGNQRKSVFEVWICYVCIHPSALDGV